jgi:hypothetical protein
VKPSAERIATPWRCRHCRALFLAHPDRRGGTVFRGGVTSASYAELMELEYRASSHRAALCHDDLEQLKRCVPTLTCQNHRRSERHSVAALVNVYPLGDDFRLLGSSALGCTVDVSCGGLSLVHPEPIEASYFLVEFLIAGQPLPPVIFQPMRCSRIGSSYAVAGEFVSRAEF